MNTPLDDEQALRDALTRLATDYRAAQPDAAQQARIAQRYHEQLARLHALGWTGALGQANELPDELLPKDYLARRAQILSDLEDRLGEQAQRYRRSASPAAERQAVADYCATLEEMYRIGHWLGIPDPDSSLPDPLMPPHYHECRQRLIRTHGPA
jgi:DNA-binding transcriptional regulator PaaX